MVQLTAQAQELRDRYLSDVRAHLTAAGATPVGRIVVAPSGDKIAMLRDPWGIAIQFVKRADPMLS